MSKKQKIGVIFLLFLTMNLFLSFYFRYIHSEKTQMIVSNSLYTTWNVILQDVETTSEKLREHLPDNSRIFWEHDEGGIIRTLYQRGDWIPPLIEGNFFAEREGQTTPQAVVGASALSELENQNEIVIEGRTHEIVGVLGAGFPSPLDSLILLNYVGSLPYTERIILDADQATALEDIHQTFDLLTVNENQALERFLNSNIFGQLVRINVFIISVFLIVITSYSYISLFKKSDRTRHLLGERKIGIFLGHIRTISSCFLISGVAVYLLNLWLGEQMIFQQLLPYLLIWLGVVVGYSMIFSLQRWQGRIVADD